MATLAPTLLESLPTYPSEEDIRFFHEQGFLAFRDALSAAEIEAAKEGLRELVRRTLAPGDEFTWVAGDPNKSHNYQGMMAKSRKSGFNIDFEPGADPRALKLDEAERVIRNFNNLHAELPIFSRIGCESPRIQAVLEALLGPGHKFHGSMALSKPAKIGGMKPWHQDVAYFSVGNWDGVCGVWIALDEATVENGCMHVLPGGHKLGPLRHIHTHRDCEIDDQLMDQSRALPIPLPPGGILFFHGMIPHFTPDNRSEKRRRALQFHYLGADNAIIPNEKFIEEFRTVNGDAAYCLAGDTRRK